MKHGPDFSTSRLSFTAHYISRDDDFVLSAYNPKVRKIDFIETGHPILCRETTTYKPKEAGFVPNAPLLRKLRRARSERKLKLTALRVSPGCRPFIGPADNSA